MTTEQVQLDFHFPIATLCHEAELILSAAEKESAKIGARLTERGDTFIPDTEELRKTVSTAVSGSARTVTNVTDLTLEQRAALAVVKSKVNAARITAKKAFRKQDVKLRNDFQVGINEPSDIASVLERAEIVVAS